MSCGDERTARESGRAMGTVVNLRNHRKRKAREAREKQADDNRALFGLSKLEKDRNAAAKARDERSLDGKKREGRPAQEETEGPPQNS